jgi:AcrR family transcriptional regulator
MKSGDRRDPTQIIEKCLGAFVAAGKLDLSLDQLAAEVSISKRMLIHYFGTREELEIRAIGLLEDQLRASFSPAAFPSGTSRKAFVLAMWERSTDPASRGVLQVIMDVTRRGWSGSERGKAFYAEQQRMWLDLLQSYFPNTSAAEELLLLFQGAILVYLVTGDAEQGRRALLRTIKRGKADTSSQW